MKGIQRVNNLVSVQGRTQVNDDACAEARRDRSPFRVLGHSGAPIGRIRESDHPDYQSLNFDGARPKLQISLAAATSRG